MKEKIILGTVQFGLNYGISNNSGKPTDEELNKILSTAYHNNICFLDTAEAYGDSQKRIGDFHKDFPGYRFNIITKFSHDNFHGSFKKQITHDIDLLGVENLYAYLFHNYQSLIEYSKRINELIELKEKGLIKKIGISLYTNEEINNILDNYDFIDLIQIPFNIFDNLNLRGDALKRIKDKGIEIHTRSVFLQGLFFKDKLPDKLKSLKPYLKVLHSISKEFNMSMIEITLNYCLSQPLIDKVLIGIDTEKQLLENINSIKKADDNLWDTINDHLKIKEKELLNPVNW